MTTKILLIEDEPDQVFMLQTRLEASGFEVASAQDGEEGLQKIRSEKPDVILLDIVMPKKDGLEVCLAVKGDAELKSIPIIMLTAAGLKDLEKKCLDAGADCCIRKPYESSELISSIKATVNGK